MPCFQYAKSNFVVVVSFILFFPYNNHFNLLAIHRGFEFNATLPGESILEITAMDADDVTPDDIIGNFMCFLPSL